MAYNIEYYHSYYDVRGTQHRIDLLAKDYSGGSTAIQVSEGRQPVRIRHMQRSTNWEEVVIQGLELLFSFYVTRADADTFDALLESGYKDYRVDYYINSELVFRGWVKPENITKDYLKNPPFLNIKLSATDALADLKDEDFLDSDGSPITGTYSELEILKYALSPIDIPLDFKIQLNTYEVNYMESDECPLEHINVDCRRFVTTGADGRQEYKSCWEVIESILKKYNCNLKQIKGQYCITNYFEEDSYEYDYDWSTLTQDSSRASTDNILDISSYNVEHQIIQQKIRPLDKVGITFRNKDLGGDVTGMDLSDWANAAIWTIDFSDGYGVTGDMVTLSSDDNTYDDYIQTAVFDVASAAENEYFKITFYHRISAYTASWPLKSPTVEIEITRPDSSTQSVHFITREAWELYESPISPLLRVTATGNYQLALKFKQAAGPSNWDTADFQIQGMTISKVTISEDGDILEDVVFDEYYTLESDQGIETYEAEFIIADGGQITEVGAMLFEDSAEHITEGWSRYGGGEDSRLIDLYARNILNNRYEYKDYLRGVRVFDPDHNIGFEKILTINGLNYIIMGYDLDCKNCFVTLNLIELVTVEQSSYGDITRSVLSTIDGKPATGSEVHVSGVPDHNDLDGIAGSADGYHLSSAQYANVGNLDSMAYESTDDYYTSSEINTWRNSVTQTEMGYLHGVTSGIQGQLNVLDNYGSWEVKIGDEAEDDILSGEELRFIEGANITLTRSSGLGSDGNWFGITIAAAGGWASDVYKYITDGTNTSIASGTTDTFKLRSADNKLLIEVTDNDATHGDNALFTIQQGQIDHNSLANYASNRHFLMTDIDHLDTALSTGLVKVTTGTGAISVITDSSSNWDSAYSHISASNNPHSTTISNLDDTTISSVGNNEVLQYYSSGSYWRNRTLAEAGISAVGHTHAYDNYVSWAVKIADESADSILSGEELRIIEGDNIALTRSSGLGWYGIEIDAVTGMTYPGAGIALSTGSAWGASIANNSSDWNTAYGWGDHGEEGYFVGTDTTIRNLFSETVTGLTYTAATGVLSETAGYSIPTDTQITNWGTAYTHSQITTGNPHSISVNDLSDVTISSVGNGEILQYYSSGPYWRNRTLAEAGISAVGHTHSWSAIVSGKPTTLSGYGISDTMANFDTACSNGNFIFDSDFSANGIMRRTSAGSYGVMTGSASVDTIETAPLTNDNTHIPTSAAVMSWVSGELPSYGTAQYQIPYLNSGQDDFDYHSNLRYDYSDTCLFVGDKIRLGDPAGWPWKIENSSGNVTMSHTMATGGDGYSTTISAGVSSSESSSLHKGGDLTLKGGDQTSSDSAFGGDGGDVFIHGGDSTCGDLGDVYFGDGENGYLPAKTTETNVVHYDETTGKISYGGIVLIVNASIHASSVTENTLFDALDSYIPVTNDEIVLSGGYSISSVLYAVSKAVRTGSTTIDIYSVHNTGRAVKECANGDGTTFATYMSIAW